MNAPPGERRDEDEPSRDGHLLAALRHAPDMAARPPEAVSLRVLAAAHRAVATGAAAPTAHASTPAGHRDPASRRDRGLAALARRAWRQLNGPIVRTGVAFGGVGAIVIAIWWDAPADPSVDPASMEPEETTVIARREIASPRAERPAARAPVTRDETATAPGLAAPPPAAAPPLPAAAPSPLSTAADPLGSALRAWRVAAAPPLEEGNASAASPDDRSREADDARRSPARARAPHQPKAVTAPTARESGAERAGSAHADRPSEPAAPIAWPGWLEALRQDTAGRWSPAADAPWPPDTIEIPGPSGEPLGRLAFDGNQVRWQPAGGALPGADGPAWQATPDAARLARLRATLPSR